MKYEKPLADHLSLCDLCAACAESAAAGRHSLPAAAYTQNADEPGCGYCLRLRGADALPAVAILQDEQINYEKLYALDESGTPREQAL